MHLAIEPMKYILFVPNSAGTMQSLHLIAYKPDEKASNPFGATFENFESEERAVERFLSLCKDEKSYHCYSSDKELVTVLSEAYREFSANREKFLATYTKHMDGSQDHRTVIYNHVCDAYYYEKADAPLDQAWLKH